MYIAPRAANLAHLDDNLYIHNQTDLLQDMRAEQPLYETSRIDIVVDQDVFADVDFVSMNPGVGFGRLQELDPDERPLPRDIVIYEALPNDLPRVAGIITTVHQTPLSHVNLRAKQNQAAQRLHPRCHRQHRHLRVSSAATCATR